EEEQDPIAPDASEFNKAQDGDSSFKFDAPEYRHAFDAIPNEHSPEMLSLYLVFKIYSQGRKIGTADTIHATFKHMWKLSDGDKYRGKWYFNSTSVAWEGNPVDSAKVQDTMGAIKNQCGKDGGDCKHSLAMMEEFMMRMFQWSDEVCPPSKYDTKSTTREEQNLKTKHLAFKCFASTSWTIWSRCFELVKLQRKHLTFGLEDSNTFNTPYFELQLTNRKGWQKRINKTQTEADLRSGKFKIRAQPDLPACDAFNRMTRWVKYLEEDIYGRTLQPDDYIFPAIGANGIVQTGEHISHDDVQKWITEFAAGADLPRANGMFSTHCFRRGGAQYRFMFAPVGRRWTLQQVRWWGGWAEGEHRDTLIKYLLDELNTYEDDYSGMLLPVQPDTDRSFLGEGSSTVLATAENITLLHQLLSADIRTLSGAFDKLLHVVADAVTSPGIFLTATGASANSFHQPIPSPQFQIPPALTLTRPLIPISLAPPGPSHPLPLNTTSNSQPVVLAGGRPLPAMGLIVPDVPITLPSGKKSRRQDSWSIIMKHWEEGDPAHGLTTPLRDWPQDWLRGANKPLAMKHHQQKIVALEYIDQYVFSRPFPPYPSLAILLTVLIVLTDTITTPKTFSKSTGSKGWILEATFGHQQSTGCEGRPCTM
ncbi:hypothetical protein B0H14DRAFT_2407147, partial [Mycena olivaceomarginata]